jgi:hypothetical protein
MCRDSAGQWVLYADYLSMESRMDGQIEILRREAARPVGK